MGPQRRIKITAGDVQVAAVLGSGATADLVWDALPIEASASTWGDEIYFRTSIEAAEEPGASDVAFWPPGQALCLFFGPTPASRGAEIRAASAVNVIGKIDGDPAVLKAVPSGARIVVEAA